MAVQTERGRLQPDAGFCLNISDSSLPTTVQKRAAGRLLTDLTCVAIIRPTPARLGFSIRSRLFGQSPQNCLTFNCVKVESHLGSHRKIWWLGTDGELPAVLTCVLSSPSARGMWKGKVLSAPVEDMPPPPPPPTSWVQGEGDSDTGSLHRLPGRPHYGTRVIYPVRFRARPVQLLSRCLSVTLGTLQGR